MGIGKAGERHSPELRVVERRVFETAIKMGVPPRAEIAIRGSGEDMRKALGGG